MKTNTNVSLSANDILTCGTKMRDWLIAVQHIYLALGTLVEAVFQDNIPEQCEKPVALNDKINFALPSVVCDMSKVYDEEKGTCNEGE